MLAFTYSRAKLLKSNKSVSQSCAVAKSEKVWRATAQSRAQTLVHLLRIRRACAVRSLRKLWVRDWPQHNPQSFLTYKRLAATKASRTHTTALSPKEQSSILSAKFDCPVACQNCSLFATTHDCETGF